MSGIFGFINMDGRPASREHFRAMAEKMAPWGPDGVGSMITGNAAFGHTLLIVTHESRFEKMPVYDADEDILFTAEARLDNRDELCDTLGIAHPERPATTDGQLVLKAYKKWGADSCRHIFGDWSFAAWRNKEQKLFLARDHMGNTGLYYYFKPPLIVFASDTEAILAHPEVPCKLNEMHLARRMVFDYTEQTWSQTYWLDVCSLAASHSITISQRKESIEKYWYLEKAPPIRFESDQEYLEAFLEQFRRAVRIRLNSVRPIGTQLSAGLDSSSVTALAAEALLEHNQPLAAFTSVPLYASEKYFPDRLTDEWTLAHQVAERYKNIEHIPIQSLDISPLAAVRQGLKILHEPQTAAANMYWIISIFENARRRNIGVMLTGQLGNGGVSWSGGKDYICYLFARRQWHKGSQALKEYKKNKKISWYRAVKSQLLLPVLSPLWSDLKRFLHPSKQERLFYHFPSGDFLRRLRFHETGLIPRDRLLDPLEEQMLTTIRNGTMVGPFWNSCGALYNMEVRDPTADVRLLEFCMGIPDEQYRYAGGNRMLIKRAMTEVLPDALRWNVKRGRQAADIMPRIFEQQDELEKALERLGSANEVICYLSIEEMKQAWDSVKTSGANHFSENINALLRAIQTGYFLLEHSGKKT